MLKTSFFTGIGTVIAQVSGIVVTKIIAVTLGTTGVAMISQFIDFITMSTSIATGGIQHGVVKYVAEYKDNRNELSKILSTSLRITLVSTLFFGLLILLFANPTSFYLFKTNIYTSVLRIFGINIVLFGLNTLLIKILNGAGEIKKLVFINISNSLFGLLITSASAYYLGLKAALIALSVSQSVVFFISIFFIKKSVWFDFSLFSLGFDKKNVIRLLNFTLMGICMMVLTPLVNIGIRNYIIGHLSINDAGIWSGLWKISNSYLAIITLTLSYYYLPKLSYLTDVKLIRREIISGYKIITPILIVFILLVFIFKDYIIILIYSKDFMEMKNLFPIQLMGDFFKILSFILSYFMLAKAKTKMFILTSVIFAIITYSLSILLMKNYGLQGVIYAYAITYFLYLLTMIYLFKDYLYESTC